MIRNLYERTSNLRRRLEKIEHKKQDFTNAYQRLENLLSEYGISLTVQEPKDIKKQASEIISEGERIKKQIDIDLQKLRTRISSDYFHLKKDIEYLNRIENEEHSYENLRDEVEQLIEKAKLLRG